MSVSQLTYVRTHFAPLRRFLPVIIALFSGAALRLWMLRAIPQFSQGDSLIYGDLAKNLLQHGQYAVMSGDALAPTLIRLPGYPLFLAFCFRLFGMENYTAAVWLQIVLELIGCLLIADFAGRIVSVTRSRTAYLAALFLAVLCPFTASYTGAPLTETPTLFTIALALWSMARFRECPSWTNALWFTFATTYGAFLRPDGALLAVALIPGLIIGLPREAISRHRLAKILTTCILLAILPFALWTWRNWRVFHVVQPLAPRYANDPGESTYPGWQRWMKTWCLDYASTYSIYWNMPSAPLDITQIPDRAFDSQSEYLDTVALLQAYENNARTFSPEIDAGFAALAQQRIHTHPLRYYVLLPSGRMLDMWFRPRVENLPIDLDWWNYSNHESETRFSWAWIVLNAAFILCGLVGLFFRPRFWSWMLLYFILRSLLLMTIEAPEARYTLECFPMLFALSAAAIAGLCKSKTSASIQQAP